MNVTQISMPTQVICGMLLLLRKRCERTAKVVLATGISEFIDLGLSEIDDAFFVKDTMRNRKSDSRHDIAHLLLYEVAC